MESKAFVFYLVDASKSKDGSAQLANLIIFEPSGVQGFGGAMAQQIVNQTQDLSAEEITAYLEEFEDHWKHATFSYGGRVDIVPYAGDGKKKIDTIKKQFETQVGERQEGAT